MTDDNNGLGTTVLKVRRMGWKGNPDSPDAWADVLVDGDYDGEYFQGLAPYMLVNNAGYVQMSQRAAKDSNLPNYLHHMVLKPKKGMWVQFKNGNPQDCRTSNLKQVSPKEAVAKRNQDGFSVGRTSKTGYHGVIRMGAYNYKARYKGILTSTSYRTPEDAARAYDKVLWEDKHYLRRLNFPEEYGGKKIADVPVPEGPEVNIVVGYCIRCNLIKRLTNELCEECKEELNERNK